MIDTSRCPSSQLPVYQSPTELFTWATMFFIYHIAVSRKVVGKKDKSACDNLERLQGINEKCIN